ncbi:MAG: uroporphyrinogen-III C-methyltransferase [Chloroflexota bacterium]|nr:uroporphyrinogen-III C-methyltransferase [Chloroflexota bacterium]
MRIGKVYLVGAGPGDAGLITVKGLDCLQRADVVVYDRLIDDGLLACVRSDADILYVGKSSKSHAVEQSEINRILVDKAKAGNTVVRLKGGDPFVLGRGGEEAEALVEHGIPFEVVPGVTSAVAAPAYAGIPVTHRGVASSFAVVTGHEDPSKEDSMVDWRRLGSAVDTIVCLMGMGNLSTIVDELIDGGKPADTPVALIREGTTPRQRTIVGTLATIVELAAREGFEPPAAIVVGDVVNLREKINWFDNRPLFGKRVLVTRSRAQAGVLSRLLSGRGADPVELPVVEARDLADASELDEMISRISDFQWVLFTSANGVDAVWKRMRRMGLDARWFGEIKIGAIGPATADSLESRGLHPDFTAHEYTSKGMLEGLAELGVAGCRILLPRSDIAPRELIEGLVQLGADPFEVTAYLTAEPAGPPSTGIEMIDNGEIDIVTFTSSSTVANTVKVLDGKIEAINRAKVACIGPVTASAAEKAGLRVDIIAQEHTVPGLVEAIEAYFAGETEGES